MTGNLVFDGPRLLRPEEWRASQQLFEICFNDGDPSATIEEDNSAESMPHSGETYIMSYDGKPVSQISISFTPLRIYDSLLRVGWIGGVCTHPHYRGYGLASRLMTYCTTRLVEGGAQLMIISGGRGLYTRLGNVPMGKFANFQFTPTTARPMGRQVKLRNAQPADAALCSRLYQAEPVHFIRPITSFTERFHPHPIGFHAEDYIIEIEGKGAAYLLLNVPWDEMDEPGQPVRCVFEYAGSRVAVAAGLAEAAQTPGLRELQAPIPWQDSDLIQLVSGTASPLGWCELPDHTIRVINFPALMRRLRPSLAAHLTPTLRRGLRFEQSGPLLGGSGGDCYAFIRGKDRLELDGAGMTRLVFGDPSGDNPPSAPGALDEILSALFPLPSFFVGPDYH